MKHQRTGNHSAAKACASLLSRVAAVVGGTAIWTLASAQTPATDGIQAAPARAWTVEPNLSLRLTHTNNADLTAAKQSDTVTEVGAGLRVSSNRGALRGFVDYTLFGDHHTRGSADDDIRHQLNGAMTAELIQGTAFVDMRASYLRRAVSAFGPQSPDPTLGGANRDDVGDFEIAPSLRGRFAGVARYEARVRLQTMRAKDTDAADVDNIIASLHLDGGGTDAGLGWFADASHARTDYRAGRRTFDRRLSAGVAWTLDGEWRLNLRAGREATDLLVLAGKSYTTWGARAEWSPTPRTNLSADVEKRFFGTSHALRLAHRTPLTAWALSDVRELVTSSAQSTNGLGSAYDLFFRQFASNEPDEAKRDALVRDYLRTNGIDPNAAVANGFLASAATLRRSQLLSVGLAGARHTVTMQVVATREERADPIAVVTDDLSAAREVRQRGLSLDWAYRLTPRSTINLGGAYQRSTSDSAALHSTLKTATLQWTSTLGPRLSGLVGARRAVFDSATTPYEEDAVFAALRYAF